MSAEDASAAQGQMLASINVTGNSEGAASLVLAVVTAAPGVVLSVESQTAALSILSAVASGPLNVSGDAAQSITGALSAVASSASVSNPAALAVVQNVLTSMAASQSKALVASLANLAPGESPPPAVTSSKTIQTLVQVDAPGSTRLTTTSLTVNGSASAFEPMPAGLVDTSSPVVTQFLSLAFDPNRNPNTTGVTRLAFKNPDGSEIPVANAATPIRFTLPAVNLSASPGDQAVCSFWDPAANAYATHGCVGVPSPYPRGHSVYFVDGFTAANDTALALAWNISGPMVDDGSCSVALIDCNDAQPRKIYPNPRSPLLVPAIACPPRDNSTNVTQPVLRVYYGAACQLWQTDNDYNCTWDAIKQAFVGGGCVASTGATQCMCRHLTDFASARVPKVQTCSLSDMTSLSPGDIITKLRFLFIVVASLFGFMNVGALIAAFMDLGEKRKTLAALQSPECGFQELPGGVWTWTCEQEPLTAAVQAPQGSAFALSSVMGLPFVRLRAALPEEFFAGSVGQALGRRAGLSVSGLQEARDDNVQAMKQLAAAFSCCKSAPQPTIPAFDETVESLPTTAPRVQRLGKQLPQTRVPQRDSTQATPSRLVGTALALAFISNAKTLSVVELARRTAAASAFFAGVTVPNTMHGFDSLLSSFLVMLSPGNLSSRGDWLEKARLWRLIFLQQPDGGWRMTDSLAFALEAHAGKRPEHVPKRSKLLDVIGLITGDSSLGDFIDDALTSSDDGGGSDSSDGDAPRSKAKPLTDCPLTFSATALRRRMPPDLLRVNDRYEAAKAKQAALRTTPRADAPVAVGRAEGAAPLRARQPLEVAVERSKPLQSAAPEAELSMNLGTCISILGRPFTPFEHPVRAVVQKAQPVRDAGSDYTSYTSASESVLSVSGFANVKRVRVPARIPVERIWCTALALAVLEEADSSWLVDDEAEPERTVVDLGRAFLKAQSRESHRLRRLLSKGVLSEAAEKSRSAWKRIQAAYVAQLRDTDVLNKFNALTHLQRASSRVVRSCMIDHSTFAVFLDTAGYLARWQRFMILITLVLSTLLTSIWFYYSRGATCCTEIRTILDCDPVGDCLGFTGDCGDLQSQFADLQGPFVYSDGPGDPPTEHDSLADYVCHAFPDDAYVTDQFFVGLISVAVALPVDMILVRMFEASNEGDAPEQWLEAPSGNWKLLLGKDCHHAWNYDTKDKPVSDLVKWIARRGGEDVFAIIMRLIAWLWVKLRGQPAEDSKAEDNDDKSDAAESFDSAEARSDACSKRGYAFGGLLGVYVVWAVFAWVIFTYGMLIYKQLGDSAQKEFAKTWGVGYSLNNASEWQDVFKTAAKTAIILVILDMLRVTKDAPWFEEHVDFISMQATLFNGAARGWWSQTRRLVALQNRLVDD